MTHAACPKCGHLLDASQGERVERDGLVVCLNPPSVFYGTRKLRSPEPSLTRFLAVLVRWGEASHELFYDKLDNPDSSSATIRQYMHNLRRWIEYQDLPFEIQTMPRWGYRLVRMQRGEI